MPTTIVNDLTGQRFGRWAVLERSSVKHRRVWWVCRCECGVIRSVRSQNLTRGITRSCGCLKDEASRARCSNPKTHPALQHGHARDGANSAEYRAWVAAKNRCMNPGNEFYPDYGGRGITICPEWVASFEAFLRDMGPRPGSGYSLDRKDNDGPYAPGNCRWATPAQQASNRRPMRRGPAPAEDA